MFSLVPFIDSDFNPLLLQSFLAGAYHLLFIQAVWKLWHRGAHRLYILALILLFVSCTFEIIFGWVKAHAAFVVHSTSALDIDAEFSNFAFIAPDVALIVSFLVSDGIIIWRSHVLMGKAWSLTILVALLLGSAACNIAFVILPEGSPAGILLAALALVLSAITTIFATVTIALKIILATRGSGAAHYSYSRVIEIIVQSAALESLVLLADAIAEILAYKLALEDVDVSVLIRLLQLDSYVSACRVVVMGIAPTLIAFRVSKEKPKMEVESTKQIGSHSPGGKAAHYHVEETNISSMRFEVGQQQNSNSETKYEPDIQIESVQSGQGNVHV